MLTTILQCDGDGDLVLSDYFSDWLGLSGFSPESRKTTGLFQGLEKTVFYCSKVRKSQPKLWLRKPEQVTRVAEEVAESIGRGLLVDALLEDEHGFERVAHRTVALFG